MTQAQLIGNFSYMHIPPTGLKVLPVLINAWPQLHSLLTGHSLPQEPGAKCCSVNGIELPKAIDDIIRVFTRHCLDNGKNTDFTKLSWVS